MRNGFNQFRVDYMNELTANQWGAASVFGGNTPTSFINYSLDTIAAWYQGKSDPRTGRPEDFEPVIINGRRVLRRKQTELDKILQLPTGPGTPPIAGGQSPAQTGGVRPCTDQDGFLNRVLGRCCPFEIVNGQCIMVSDGKGTIGDDPTGSGKKAEALLGSIGIGGVGGTTGIVIVAVGLILLLGAIVSLR